MIRQFTQNQKRQYQQRQPRHNIRHYNQVRKQTQCNKNGLSAIKHSPSISLNKSAHKRKISLSNIKKLKESKNIYPVERVFEGKKKLSSQNTYPTYQYNYTKIPILKNVIPILEEKLIYCHKSPQPFQVSNGKQANQKSQNLTYYRNTMQQKASYFSQNSLYQLQRIKSTEKISPLAFKQSKLKQKKFTFTHSNQNVKLVNPEIKSSIKQKQLSAEIATKNIQFKRKQKQIKSKTESSQIGFRRTQSLGSDDNEQDDISIVLEHHPIEQIQEDNIIQQYQTLSPRISQKSFNNYVKSIFHS